jgi:polyhydroxyalkanoate synthase
MRTFMDRLAATHFALSDEMRRTQAQALDALGFGPQECGFEVIASGPHWRLRRYAGPHTASPLLMVPAPIKRPYVFDLTPGVSAVRYCRDRGLQVYLIEWLPPEEHDGRAGLDAYAREAISACATRVLEERPDALPFLMGHSLGGTLAAIFCALEPQSARGLVLLGAPLCFEPGSSRFRDALVAMVPSTLSEEDLVPGSLLSQVSAAAAPEAFVWSRLTDAAFSLADASAFDMHARIERWALDEVALPGKLVSEIVERLYGENRLCRGTLSVSGRTVGPSTAKVPTLAIINASDEVAPIASVKPFIDKMATTDTQIIEHRGEVGVGLQHLAMLAGRQAFARVWPQIIAWLQARSGPATQEPGRRAATAFR